MSRPLATIGRRIGRNAGLWTASALLLGAAALGAGEPLGTGAAWAQDRTLEQDHDRLRDCDPARQDCDRLRDAYLDRVRDCDAGAECDRLRTELRDLERDRTGDRDRDRDQDRDRDRSGSAGGGGQGSGGGQGRGG